MTALHNEKNVMDSINVGNGQNENSPKESPSESQRALAFTIQFSDNKDFTGSHNLNKFASRHTRNVSLSNFGDVKKKQSTISSLQAIGLSPLPSRKYVMPRRAGYHSEGYFSSDQEDDIRSRSDFLARKLKNGELGGEMNKQKLQEEAAVRGSSHIKPNFHLPIDKPNFNEFMDIRDKVDSKRHNTSLTNINSSFYDYNCKEEWLVASTNSDNDIEIRVHTQNPDEVTDEVEDVIDSSNDTVSEAGTYTIERDQPCPEEEEARKKLENIIGFMKTNQEKGIAQDKDEDNAYKSSLYRDNPNWINEWASQVAKHNHESEIEGQPHQAKTSVLQFAKSRVKPKLSPSPTGTLPATNVAVLPPSGRKLTPSPQRTRTHLYQPQSNITISNDPPVKHDNKNPEHYSDSSLETESYLRATESVVTAMQARMTLSLDSGGESDVDTSHSCQGPAEHEHSSVLRRASNASDSSTRRDGRQSDSSSEAEGRSKFPGPQTRYNRAFSLRRARLDCEPTPFDKKKNKTTSKPDVASTSVNKVKKNSEPVKVNQPRLLKTKSPKPENTSIARTDSGKFSTKTTKPGLQSTHATKQIAPKKDVKKNQSARSNSTLSSREVEFQNWKRRKSYDPMKAAAEGKKKEAAKKVSPLSTSMTQSSIVDSDNSPSHQNPVLRSASFHGTGDITPNYVSSEEEVTLSADEEDSPLSACPIISNTDSPSKALECLTMASVHGISEKIKGSSTKLLEKLRYLYAEDQEKSMKLAEVMESLTKTTASDSSINRSPSRELSAATIRSLKCIENVFEVLDDVLFDEEDFDSEWDH